MGAARFEAQSGLRSIVRLPSEGGQGRVWRKFLPLTLSDWGRR